MLAEVSLREDRPRQGYDQYLRRWVELEPYLSQRQLWLVLEGIEWDEDAHPFLTISDPTKPPAPESHDPSFASVKTLFADFPNSNANCAKRLPPNPKNPHRDRDGHVRHFHHERPRAGRGADGNLRRDRYRR